MERNRRVSLSGSLNSRKKGRDSLGDEGLASALEFIKKVEASVHVLKSELANEQTARLRVQSWAEECHDRFEERLFVLEEAYEKRLAEQRAEIDALQEALASGGTVVPPATTKADPQGPVAADHAHAASSSSDSEALGESAVLSGGAVPKGQQGQDGRVRRVPSLSEWVQDQKVKEEEKKISAAIQQFKSLKNRQTDGSQSDEEVPDGELNRLRRQNSCSLLEEGKRKELNRLGLLSTSLTGLDDIQHDFLPVSRAPGFVIETGYSASIRSRIKSIDAFGVLDAKQDVPYFKKFFYKKPHTTYIGYSMETGVVVVVVDKAAAGSKEDATMGCLVIQETSRQPVSLKGTKHWKKRLLEIVGITDPLTLKEVKGDVDDQLLEMEEAELRHRKTMKVGILYAKDGQDECEMFCNEHGSAEFDHFLQLVGEGIDLVGWKGYNGGLDVDKGTTGEVGLYAEHRGVSIMYHVSTLIPYVANDPQQIGRKRHLGNDVVLVIFKEGVENAFDPSMILSRFNFVMIVVQKLPDVDDKPYYQVSVATKRPIGPFPPALPNPPIFMHGELFREFLLTKIVNAERAAMESRAFAPRLRKARGCSLRAMASQHIKGVPL
mmetsp:Transcript_22215/g.87518  ORF Transcript_22215/g.87518 Transcript_22215/m.87518 type:complete len:606 (+) Transcript_22215:2441-4258(+)